MRPSSSTCSILRKNPFSNADIAEDSGARAHRPMMGKFAGTRVPTEEDFAAVRRTLWGRMPRKETEAHL